jgi:hypothetical protein
MHKNATKCNETLSKWHKNKHGASKIMDTLETYQGANDMSGESRGGSSPVSKGEGEYVKVGWWWWIHLFP